MDEDQEQMIDKCDSVYKEIGCQGKYQQRDIDISTEKQWMMRYQLVLLDNKSYFREGYFSQ